MLGAVAAGVGAGASADWRSAPSSAARWQHPTIIRTATTATYGYGNYGYSNYGYSNYGYAPSPYYGPGYYGCRRAWNGWAWVSACY